MPTPDSIRLCIDSSSFAVKALRNRPLICYSQDAETRCVSKAIALRLPEELAFLPSGLLLAFRRLCD